MTSRVAGGGVTARQGSTTTATTAAAFAEAARKAAAFTLVGMTADVVNRPDGNGTRPVAESLTLTRVKRGLIETVAASYSAKRRAEQLEREERRLPTTRQPGDDLPEITRQGLQVRIASVVAGDGVPGGHPAAVVPACSFGGGRVLLEVLPRVSAQEIAAELPRPSADGEILVEVSVRLRDGRIIRSRVAVTTYESGFGRPWLCRCPACNRRVRLLFVRPDSAGLACDACTGAVRYTVRVGHRRWFRDVVRHVRRAASLHERAARRRIRGTTRRRLLDQAQHALDVAVAGLRRLGPASG